MPRLLIAALSGAALGLAFEPIRIVVLLPLSIAALLWLVRGVSVGRGAVLGWVFGLAHFLVLLVWLRAVGSDAWIALSLFQSLYFALLGAGLTVVGRLRGWPLWSAAVWVGVETLRGSWPMGGLTWGRVSFAVIDTPFEAWLPWVGATGTGLVVVACSGILAWSALRIRQSTRVVAGLVAATVVVLALPWAAAPSRSTDGARTVAVVQGDVPGNGDDLVSFHREVTESHVALTRELGRAVARGDERQPDLVLWPENTTAVDPFDDGQIRGWIRDAAASVKAPVLVGGIVDAPESGQVLNQGIVVDPETGAGDRYTKRHPVPYGEYIPYRDRLGDWSSERLGLVPRDMVSGTRSTPLRIAGTLVGDAICFDVAYDDAIGEQVRGGARLLVVQTSNALFIHTGQIEQQFAISRVRALETGRTVVVAAVNGRTGVIDADGDVVAAAPVRTRSVLVVDVPLTTSRPPSLWVGPWLGRGSVVVALGAVLWGLLPYRPRWLARQTPAVAETTAAD